ncbi:MAG: UDP-3-O-acyl-N-acetylglucosamine deacetylase [bacterium]
MWQTTVKNSVEIKGVGLHTGKESRIIISPAPVDTGIVFNFAKNFTKIKVDSMVISTNRGTILAYNGYSIYTVEHILSALNGLEIDNVEIIVEGEEIPSCDGSAKTFVDKLKEAGIKTLDKKREVIQLSEPVWIFNKDKGIFALPGNSLSIFYVIEFPWVGKQWIFYEHDPLRYELEIAPARTFGFEEEIDTLITEGLAKGGSFSNSVIISKGGFSSPLRYPDEFVRHKLLDLMGDIYLLGRRINATIFVVKGGHNLHVELVKKIKEVIDD